MAKFIYQRRVEFADTDMAGMVHFSSFFCFLEEAEHHFLRSIGLSVMSKIEEKPCGMPRVSAHLDFVLPARFEDLLDIAIEVENVGKSSIAYLGKILRQGQVLATGKIVVVLCEMVPGGSARSMPIPDWMREKLLTGGIA